jgi:hypothetical protein
VLVTDNVPRSPILLALMMEAIRSSETSVPTKAIRRNILEDGILSFMIPYIKLRHFFPSILSLIIH